MSRKSLQKNTPAPNTPTEIQQVLEPLLADPGQAVVLLDLDGTLAPIVSHPGDVAVPPSITRLIRELSHIYLAVGIVSGRTANEARRIVGNAELAYIGNHGFETMVPGHAIVVCEEAQPWMDKIRKLTESGSVEAMTEAGVWLEDKAATLSYHYRRAQDPEAALAWLQQNIIPRAEKLGLRVSEGRMVVEIKPPVEINKGVSVGHLLDRLGARRAIYVGDDTTDIDALKELRKRRRRKDSIMVGVGVISKEMPERLPKFCDLMVARVNGVEALLEILAGREP